MVSLQGVSFSYPGARGPLLAGVDLELLAGERVLLAGPSGSGKSTLFGIVAGLIPESIPGRLEGSICRTAAAIGLVFQNPEAQMVAPTVEEEIAFGLENRGLERRTIRQRIDEILERFSITRLRERPPSLLSGGERQKVALAAALALEPDLLMLDEPTSFLDADSTAAFFDLLRRLDATTTVLLVEHKLEHALDFVERYYLLDERGRIAAHGPAEELERQKDACLPWSLAGLREADGRASAAVPHDVLAARGLAHAYEKGRAAIEQITFSLARGEIVSVMGPNGAGKTTLLEKVAALLPLSRGEVLIEGRDARGMRRREIYSRLMIVPQNPEHLFLKELVADELALSSIEGGQEAARLFRLEGLEEQNPFRLSEGEKRRLNLACAFLEPRAVLLLDEPTYGLDYGAYASLVKGLRLLRDRGVGVLMVTHSPELAFLVSDRILLLEGGKVTLSATPAELLRNDGRLSDACLPVWERLA